MAQLKVSVITRVVLITFAILVAGSHSALADKPSWAGGGKHEKHKKHDKYKKHDKHIKKYAKKKKHLKRKTSHKRYENWESHYDSGKTNFSGSKYFTEQHRMTIREYYANEYKAGRCPPGLLKKDNGCRPPGLAKRWVLGQPLQRDVIYYDLPPAILTSLGTPPVNQRFVRVDSDILMLTVGAGIVMDALDKLDGNP